jgi:hypothetical protein
MFRAYSLTIIRSFSTVHLALVSFMQVFDDRFQVVRMELRSILTLTSAECTVQNSWWWAEKMPETCRVLEQNKFGQLVQLVGYLKRRSETFLYKQTNCKSTSWFRPFNWFIHILLCWTPYQMWSRETSIYLLPPFTWSRKQKKNHSEMLRKPTMDMFRLPATKTATHYLKTVENTMCLTYKVNRLAG